MRKLLNKIPAFAGMTFMLKGNGVRSFLSLVISLRAFVVSHQSMVGGRL